MLQVFSIELAMLFYSSHTKGRIQLFIVLAHGNICTSQINGGGDRDYFFLGNFQNWDAP
jgi:hypothetical protein